MAQKSKNGRKTRNRDGADEFGAENLEFVEYMFAQYRREPASVPVEWRRYFARFADEDGQLPRHDGPSFRIRSVFNPAGLATVESSGATVSQSEILQERVDRLVRNYRVRGHIVSQVDPLGRPRPHPPELELEYYGFTQADLDREFSISTRQGPKFKTLREIVDWLQATYCRYIGVQFMHIDDLEIRNWLQFRMEETENRIDLSRDKQLWILQRLTDAVVFESFVQKKYIGAKSFSLEGAESLIPLLDLAIEQAGDEGVEEVVIGMPHRGRLNVLANVMGKRPREVFREFEDVDPELHVGRGDVKYHLGYSGDWQTASGRSVHLSLCFNPSHLEYVNPVALGRVRAKQDRYDDEGRERRMALLIHGDAAFAGEGIVQETLNLSQLEAYRIGGAVHVIVNNQLGFTTTPAEGRSSEYATDVAKLLQSPIFHVNGEQPESVAQVVKLAMDFRREFRRDVIIDMYCYRLQGHNEGDEPSFTQPLMYRRIAERPLVRDSYRRHLLEMGEVSEDEAESFEAQSRQRLDEELEAARAEGYETSSHTLQGIWEGYRGGPYSEAGDAVTRTARERLAELLEAQTRLPEDFRPHPKIERGLKLRRKMAAGERPLDWASAESLALATLAIEGHRIRMTGQDCERGTFSQRHAVLHDHEDGRRYVPLQHLADDQATVEIANSPLSEAGVLGFEYGYSLDCPDGLVFWEAQFGDFANAAQVIIDQFLASAEDKWRRLSGIVLLLPHGFEGQGPEHSSARLERFLVLAAEDNIQIVCPTTPAQYYHVLRRQALRRWRKPLVVMTPKSLLRHSKAVSDLDALAKARFQNVIPDESIETPAKVSRILLCTGKVYYDLLEEREKLERDDVAIVRVEQLYPLPSEGLQSALAPFPDGTPACWVQEEPINMGAWQYIYVRFGGEVFGRLPLSCVARPESASPATGSKSSHHAEQDELMARAFGGE